MIDDLLGRWVEVRGDPALEAEIEAALIDAVAGGAAGPALAKTLERLAREVLLRRGIPNARVQARSGPEGTFVRVVLPTGPRRVRKVGVKVDGA